MCTWQTCCTWLQPLYKFLRSPDLAVPIKLTLIKSCLLPVFTYGSAMWHASSGQAGLLETQYLKILKMVLQCTVTTPTDAVMGDLGMPNLQQHWDLCKLRCEFKLQNLPAARAPRAVFQSDWTQDPGRHMVSQTQRHLEKYSSGCRAARCPSHARAFVPYAV